MVITNGNLPDARDIHRIIKNNLDSQLQLKKEVLANSHTILPIPYSHVDTIDTISGDSPYFISTNTGSTTALYYTQSKEFHNYIVSGSNNYSIAHGLAITGDGDISQNQHAGVFIKIESTTAPASGGVYLGSVSVFQSTIPPNYVFLRNSSFGELGSRLLVNGSANFGYTKLLPGSGYVIDVTKTTGGWKLSTAAAYTTSGVISSGLTWVSGVFNDALQSVNYFSMIQAIDIKYVVGSKALVETNTLLTPPGSVSNAFATAFYSGNNMTYDFSADGGSNWITNQVLNQVSDTTAYPGSNVKFRFRLNPAGSEGVTFKYFGVEVW